jgi:archaellum component FlaG (FlaF/FlaG flagellin family)
MVNHLKRLLLLIAMTAWAQSIGVAASLFSNEASISPPGIIQLQTNQVRTEAQLLEDVRLDCIQKRRTICGKILKVLPDGLVIDSGYTNLMRDPLNRSWLVPGSAQAQQATNMVESDQPNCVCLGLVFLSNLPKKPARPAVHLYDYVNLTGYPAGQYIYTSVGDVRRTVRRFSAKLATAIEWNFNAIEKENQISSVENRTR